MSHHYSKLKWSLFVVISLLYRFDTAIANQMRSVDKLRQHSRHDNCHDYSRVNHRVNHVEETEANVRRKRRREFFISGDNCNVRRKKSVITSTAAFVSSNHQLYSKQSISKISTNPPLITPVIPTTSKRTTLTSLHLKFKTFEEMLLHHHTTPLLIDFYAPWCGPCKLMKGEISSIRDELDLLGPIVGVDENGEDGETNEEGVEEEEEEEDCSVEDVIALSSVCLEDGYIEEQQQQNNNDGDKSSSSSSDDDNQKLLEDLLTSIKAPPPVTTTTATTTSSETETSNQEQTTTTTPSQTTYKKKQSPHRRGTPSGIPVYHVNTNKFPQVGAKNHIAGLPTLVLFYEGQELWRNEGFITGKEVVTVLKELQDGGWKRMVEEKKMEVEVKTVEREDDDDEGSVNNKKEEEDGVNNKKEEKKAEVDAVVAAVGEVVKKKKRKGRRLGG